jgi:hypothetical protein
MGDVPSTEDSRSESVGCFPFIVFRDSFSPLIYYFSGPNDYRYKEAFHIPHSLEFLYLGKGKVKLSLCLTKHHGIKAY